MNKRPVKQLDPETGIAINVWPSVHAADRRYGGAKRIRLALAKEPGRAMAYGFRWEYARPEDPVTATSSSGPGWTRQAVAEYLAMMQNRLSYGKIAEKTGWSVEELRRVYDEDRLWKIHGTPPRKGGWNHGG